MRQQSLNALPLFPQWIFQGQLEIVADSTVEAQIQADVKRLPPDNQPWGYLSDRNVITKDSQKIRQLVGNAFYTNAMHQFNIPDGWKNIESVNARMLRVKPGFEFRSLWPIKYKWYQSITFIDAQSGCSELVLEDHSTRAAYMPGFQSASKEHRVTVEKYRMTFWPGYIPWSLTTNQGSRPLVAILSEFTIQPD
jgi:hypothetical protein